MAKLPEWGVLLQGRKIKNIDWADINTRTLFESRSEVRLQTAPSVADLRNLVVPNLEQALANIHGPKNENYLRLVRGDAKSAPNPSSFLREDQELLAYLHSHPKGSKVIGPSMSDWVIASRKFGNLLVTDSGVVNYAIQPGYNPYYILDYSSPKIGVYDLPDYSTEDQFEIVDTAARIAKEQGDIIYDSYPWEDEFVIEKIIQEYLTPKNG